MAENSKYFIVDSSFILSYLLPDEHIDNVEKIFTQYETGEIDFLGIRILTFEVFNGLCNALRSKRISKKLVKDLGERFLKLNIKPQDVDYLSVSDLAIDKNLTFYDACYLYVSNKRRLQLLTLDEALQKLV